MPVICPHCGRTGFRNIQNHLKRTPVCQTAIMNMAAPSNRPIPPFVSTGGVLSPPAIMQDTIADSLGPDGSTQRVNPRRRRRAEINYSEQAAAKTARSNQPLDDLGPSPADDLGDYMDTHHLSANEAETARLSSSRRLEMEQVAEESWNSLYSSLQTHNSVAAVASPPPLNLNQNPPSNGVAAQEPTIEGDTCLCQVDTITMKDQNSQVVTTPQDRSMARIYRLCDSVGSPQFFGDALINQLRKEMLLNSFDPCHAAITRRGAFMNRSLTSTGSSPPEAIRLSLESGQTVTVFRFPFQETLQAHLLSSVFSDLDNLSVNESDPWGYYSKDGAILKDFLDGTWYPESYQRFLRSKPDASTFCFHAALGYTDKTHTDGIEKNTLEPFMMTSVSIRQSQREVSKNWFCVGLVPNLNMISAAARRGKKGRKYNKSSSLRDYHRCVQELLQPLKDMQRNNPVMRFRRGDLVKSLRIVIPFAGMVGDNKSQDTIVARIVDYSKSSPRLSHRCLTEFSGSADSDHSCFLVSAKAVECLSMGALGCTYGCRTIPDDAAGLPANRLAFASIPLSDNLDQWKAFIDTFTTKKEKDANVRYRKVRQKLCVAMLHKVFGSHPVDNAFFGLDFGSNREGIFRATLTDILHTIEEGIIPKFLNVFYGLMGDSQRAKIDSLVELFFGEGQNRSSERPAYPKVGFLRGYTDLSRLSANERQGQLFVLSVLLQTKAGRTVLEPRFASGFDVSRSNAKSDLAGEERATQNSPTSYPIEVDSDEGGVTDEEFGGVVQEDDGRTQSSLENDALDDDNSQSNQDDNLDDSPLPDVMDNASSQDDEDDILDDVSKVNLRRLDLAYMYEGIYPDLEPFHKRRFKRVIREVLTEHALSAIGTVQFPPHLLDYRNVVRPISLNPPIDCEVEKEHPEFAITEHRQANSIKLPMEHFVYLVETLLSLISFLKYGCNLLVSLPTGSSDYDKALELFLRILVTTVERGESTNQWYLQKTLELAHFKADILFMGPASGFSTETGERGLKAWAKQPAKTAQRRGDHIFSKQVCQRIHEAGIINCVADSLPLEEDDNEEAKGGDDEMEARCANFVVEFSPTTVINRVLRSGKPHKIQIDFPPTITNWFAKKYRNHDGVDTVQLYTEMILPQLNGGKGTVLRAHPNYRSEGPWYDYVLAKYDEASRPDVETVYPCKLACFFLEPVTQEKMVLLQEVQHQSEQQLERDSQLFQHWTLSSTQNRESKRWVAKFNAIPVAALSDCIYAIDPAPIGGFSRADESDFDILVVKYAKEEWPLSFLNSPDYFAKYQWS